MQVDTCVDTCVGVRHFLLLIVCVLTLSFFFSSSFPYRSTKLVIIERLLLLAERYVITIEVGLEFSSECLICMAFSHTLLEECSLAHVIAHSWSFQTFFFPQPETSLPVSKCPQTPPYDWTIIQQTYYYYFNSRSIETLGKNGFKKKKKVWKMSLIFLIPHWKY